VPIEKHKQYGGRFLSGGSLNPHFGGGGGAYVDGMDGGPPYIVKLLNLPVTCNDLFVEDLFKSRYTPFVKFKIVADPSSNILETRVIKKVAFVELRSFQDVLKAVKWNDLYYKDNRRVVVERADFRDFQNCMQFNQQHARQIEEIVDDYVEQQNTQHPGVANGATVLKFGNGVRNLTIPSRGGAHDLQMPPLRPLEPVKPRFNPFGAAKPVDVVAKQHEIEKKLIMVNNTTFKTIGEKNAKESDSTRRPSVHLLKRPDAAPASDAAPTANKDDSKSKFSPAPIPPTAAYGGLSLAEMLKAKGSQDHSGRASPKTSTPKEAPSKPVILKKKVVTRERPRQNENPSTEANENDSAADVKAGADPTIPVEVKELLHETSKTKSELATILQKSDAKAKSSRRKSGGEGGRGSESSQHPQNKLKARRSAKPSRRGLTELENSRREQPSEEDSGQDLQRRLLRDALASGIRPRKLRGVDSRRNKKADASLTSTDGFTGGDKRPPTSQTELDTASTTDLHHADGSDKATTRRRPRGRGGRGRGLNKSKGAGETALNTALEPVAASAPAPAPAPVANE
jgi:hypothetical protein